MWESPPPFRASWHMEVRVSLVDLLVLATVWMLISSGAADTSHCSYLSFVFAKPVEDKGKRVTGGNSEEGKLVCEVCANVLREGGNVAQLRCQERLSSR
jgi:hypothetical protein